VFDGKLINFDVRLVGWLLDIGYNFCLFKLVGLL